jgi:hypothetical protein
MELICKDCDTPFVNSSKLELHMDKVHNKVRVLTCKICDEKFKGYDNFDKHLEFTHGTSHWSLNLALKQIKRDVEKMGT